jgi:hypothetical protein
MTCVELWPAHVAETMGTIRRAAHERAGVKPGPRRQFRRRCDQKTSDRALTQRAVREANFPEEVLGG